MAGPDGGAAGPSRRLTPATLQRAFVQACRMDVAVAKPGNVSWASPGHGMQAAQFVASARAAAPALVQPQAKVGARIEAAVRASWAAAGCNTNLGIVLLCAPLAAAAERWRTPHSAAGLRLALEPVLAALDVDDARAAYRAIALANPGGLGEAPAQDVRQPPSLPLRAAMALAQAHDTIARQYANGFAQVWEIGLAALPDSAARAWALRLDENDDAGDACDAAHAHTVCNASDALAVQRVYRAFLQALPDTHIVRKHGSAVAQTVMRAAQAWTVSAPSHGDCAAARWDAELKAAAINPGTSADLTVATLFLGTLLAWAASR